METSVEFESALFRPFLPEAAQVNPQVYGAELAFWLAQQLADRGVMTSYPICEDWGWFLEYITEEGDEYWLCCGNSDGKTDYWFCYLSPRVKGWFGRKKAKIEKAKPLLDTLKLVLAETAQIQNVTWSSD
jgi:hypothetical protein